MELRACGIRVAWRARHIAIRSIRTTNGGIPMADLDQATQTMIANLEKNTGHALSYWTGLVKESGLVRHGEIVKMLKSDHGMTHGYANLVAHTANSSAASASDGDELVDGQYSGDKAPLRPIYDRIIGEVAKFGTDVELAPKKAYVSLRRSKQFVSCNPRRKRAWMSASFSREGNPRAVSRLPAASTRW
jgi:Domain of unknown function (DUF4287)/Domain of unknown function (DUF5655)